MSGAGLNSREAWLPEFETYPRRGASNKSFIFNVSLTEHASCPAVPMPVDAIRKYSSLPKFPKS
jgi:hypothetical protein